MLCNDLTYEGAPHILPRLHAPEKSSFASSGVSFSANGPLDEKWAHLP
jgi:hypothetical protein